MAENTKLVPFHKPTEFEIEMKSFSIKNNGIVGFTALILVIYTLSYVLAATFASGGSLISFVLFYVCFALPFLSFMVLLYCRNAYKAHKYKLNNPEAWLIMQKTEINEGIMNRKLDILEMEKEIQLIEEMKNKLL